MINNIELLKRLYATAASGKCDDPKLASDVLDYISALEHAVLEDGRGVISFAQLLLILGQAHGALTNVRNRESLKAAARQSPKLPFHLFALREQLTEILDEAGTEVIR